MANFLGPGAFQLRSPFEEAFEDEKVLEAIAQAEQQQPQFGSPAPMAPQMPQYGALSAAPQGNMPALMQPPQQPAQPPQQPGSPMQQNLRQWLNSPGMAMAYTALDNISAGQPNGVRTANPIAAYQQAQNTNDVLLMRKQKVLDEKAYYKAQLEQQKIANQLALYKQMNPKASAFSEKMDAYRQSIGLGDDPNYMSDPRMSKWIEDSTTSGTSVDIQMPGGPEEKNAWEQNRLQRSITDYNSLLDNAKSADTKINRYRQLQYLNKDIGEGGPLGGAVLATKKTLEGLGIDMPFINENTTAAQLYEAIATENQFERTQMLKGAISEKEIGLAGMMDGSLANTQPGREFILQYRIAEERKSQQIADAAQDYMERTGSQFYSEREFRNSPEFRRVQERPFATPEMLSVAKEANPTAMKDYKLVGGTWYTKGKDGEAVPVF
jgi:hypothetical protein